MAKFGTIEVYEELAAQLNADPVWAEKGRKIDHTMVFDYPEPVNKAFRMMTDLRLHRPMGLGKAGRSQCGIQPSELVVL